MSFAASEVQYISCFFVQKLFQTFAYLSVVQFYCIYFYYVILYVYFTFISTYSHIVREE